MANIPLKRLSRDSEREPKGFSVCDIESFVGWINFAVIGLCFKDYYSYFLDLSDFCRFLFSEDHPNDTVFAHFGGRYDFSFILREYLQELRGEYIVTDIIPRTGGILCFTVTQLVETNDSFGKTVHKKLKRGWWLVEGRKITFRDSSAMLPFGLRSLTKNFKVPNKKGEIDYTTITKVTPELLEYLESDCKGLYQVIETYFNWPMIREAGAAYTMASQALRVFRTFLQNDIPSLKKGVDAFVRESYFGGRTEIFRPIYQASEEFPFLRSYDVNSLYPAAMRDHEFPVRFHKETQFYLEDRLGFYDVEVEVPEMYVPPLGMRHEGMEHKLIFPTGVFRGVWSTLELNYAMSVGAKIRRVYRGMLFHSGGMIFSDYINYLYEMRKKAGRDSVDNVLCKLLMNSTYGRFGLNLMREQLLFEDDPDAVPYMDIPLKNQPRSFYRLSKKTVELDSSFSNVAIAAWVTSAARVHMHRLFLEAEDELFYSDTDSVKTTHLYPRNDTDLGQLKLEQTISQACYVAPKTYIEDTTEPIYALYDEKGREITDKTSAKKVMKGFDRKKLGHLTFDDFRLALEGELHLLRAKMAPKFMPLKTAMKKGQFLGLMEEQMRQVKTRYIKRRIYQRPYRHIYDTEPLHVVNGEIKNLDPDLLKKWKVPSDADLKNIGDRIRVEWITKNRSIRDGWGI